MKLNGNRGMIFEEMINNAIINYRNKNIALIQKIPTPITPVKFSKEDKHITLAYFDKKSTVDYIGLVQEIAICFDAKESMTDKFPLQNIKNHQYEFMRDWEKQGGASFVLVFFSKYDIAYYLRFKEFKNYFEKKNIISKVKYIELKNLDKKYIIDMKNKNKINFLEKLQEDINER